MTEIAGWVSPKYAKHRNDFFPFDQASLFTTLKVSAINPCVKNE